MKCAFPNPSLALFSVCFSLYFSFFISTLSLAVLLFQSVSFSPLPSHSLLPPPRTLTRHLNFPSRQSWQRQTYPGWDLLCAPVGLSD